MNPFVAIAFLASGVQNTPTTLTLDQAIAIADRNAFANLIAQSNVALARQKINEAAGEMRPTLNVGGTYTRFDQPSTANFNGNRFTVQPVDEKSLTAKLGFVVDLSGSLLKLLQASKANFYASQDTLQATKNSIKQTVRTDYYAILRAQAQVAVGQETVTSNQELVKTTQQQMTAGTLAKVDVLNAQAQLSQAQGALISDQDQLDLAKQTLNNVLARPIQTPLEVVDVTNTPVLNATADQLTATAQSQRPEVLALQQTVRELQLIKRATSAGTAPTLNLSINGVQNIGSTGFGGRLQTASGVASLNWPIYDGGVTRARVNEAEQNVIQAQIQLNQSELSVSLQVRTSYTNYQNALSRQNVADAQVAAAKEALRLAVLKRDQGEGILLEVLNAETAYATAQTSQVSAHYDVLQAIADLQLAYGSDQLPLINSK